MAQIPYIKLDWDWAECPEAQLLKKRHGKKALLDWVFLMILMSEFDGKFNPKDPLQMGQAKRRMATSERRVRELCDWCAECGLIRADAWGALGYATSERALRDARTRARRREIGEMAAEKNWEERSEEDAGS